MINTRSQFLSFLFLFFLLFSFGLQASEDCSPWGICAHVNRDHEYGKIAEMFKVTREIGVRHMRTDLDWDQVSPSPGHWDFSRWQRVVELAEEHNVAMTAILGGNIPTRTSPPFRHLDAFLAYVERSAKTFKGRIVHWEVINEANLQQFWKEKVDAKDYATLLKATAPILRKIDPENRILFTGLAGTSPTFIRTALDHGAAEAFDIMNIHPYQWQDYPEVKLYRQIKEVRELLDRNGAADKEIWITEIGYSTAPDDKNFHYKRSAIAAALHHLGLDPKETVIGMIEDAHFNYCTQTTNFDFDDLIPDAGKRKKMSIAQIDKLSVEECPVIVLAPTESFPMSERERLLHYLRRGGTLILGAGFPFYFDLQTEKTVEVGAKYASEFHIAWKAWWTSDVPKAALSYESGEEFPELQAEPDDSVLRVFSDHHLKKGDRMIPLLYGRGKTERYPVSVIYRFNSDLKGNLIALGSPGDRECVAEEVQGRLLPRTMLLARSAGANKTFIYNLRSTEADRYREAHFGIVRRDLQEKPAAATYRTLIRYAPGEERPELIRNGAIHMARWSRSDGKRCAAVWVPFGETKTAPQMTGRIHEISDSHGRAKQFDPVSFTVTDDVTYFLGDGDFTLDFSESQMGD